MAAAMTAACGGSHEAEPVGGHDAGSPLAKADASLMKDAAFDAASTEADASTSASADASADGAAANEPLTFESVTTTLDDAGILIEKVSYRSEGLRVFGQVCRPNLANAGPYPVNIINHGGFSGITDWNGGDCASAAKRGWVAAESSYRGEDGSDGRVEVCLGEVTDVLRLMEIVRAQPYADPERVTMAGTSHGGCITLRALERGAQVKLAVDIFGPTDWAADYAFWKQSLASGSTLKAEYQGLIDALEQGTGGTPEQVPDAYAQRSPLHFSSDLDSVQAPLLIVQGTADNYVPPAQPCALADVSRGFDRYHVTLLGTVDTSAPSGCEGTWLAGSRPTTQWPDNRYLIVYDGVGHSFEGFGTSYLIADMTAFLTARFTP